MPLRGELNSVDLAHVFQMLILNQKAGTLEIVHDGVGHQIYFTANGVHVPFERDIVERRGVAALVRSGELTQEQVTRARANMEVLRRDLMSTLVDMRSISEEVKTRSLRSQLEEDVYDLFFLRDATFEFRDAESPRGDGEIDEQLILSPNGLIMEAARRVDEWEYIRELVPSSVDIFEITGDPSTLELRDMGRDAQVVIDAIDGMKTVNEIIETTGVARFAVFRAIAALLDQGIAASVSPEMVVVRARTCFDDGNVASARNLYEHAISQGTDDLVVLKGAGEAYELLGEPEKAGERFLGAGRRAEEQGDLSLALELYLRIRKLLPSQVGARERLFSMRKVAHTHLGDRIYDPTKEGLELAQILCQLERKEELAVVLAGLLELAGDDAVQIEKVADLAIGMGNVSFSIDALLAAADRRKRSRDYAGSLRCLKRAQGLDPTRVNVTNRIQAVGGAIEKLRNRRRSLLRGLAMIAGSVVVSFGYANYSSAAMKAFGRYSLEDFVATKNFPGGREHFGSIVRRYPLTVPFLLSMEKLRELEVAETNSADVERYRKQVEAEEAEKLRFQAERLVSSALSARHSGDWSFASELLHKARLLTGDEDPLGLDEGLKELDEYLSEARRLKSEAYFFRRAGRFADAHGRLMQLIKEYPYTAVAKEVELPVLVESDPPRARISVDGKPVTVGDERFVVHAETPFVVDLPANKVVLMELVSDGFATARVEVDPKGGSSIRVPLPHAPSMRAILPFAVTGPPVSDGRYVAVRLERGRVGLLDAITLESKWIRELPELADVIGAPLLLDDDLVVATSTGELLWLTLATGSLKKRVDLEASPQTSPALSAGGFAVGTAVRELLLVDVSGRRIRVPLPESRTVGPIGLGDGRFAVATANGVVWLVGIDGALTTTYSTLNAAATITTLEVDHGRIFVGDSLGKLHIADWRKADSTRTVDTGFGVAIGSINVNGDVAVLSAGGKLASIVISEARVAAIDEGPYELAAGGGDLIAVSRKSGEVRVLERRTLHGVAHYAAGEEVSIAGMVSGTRGYFVANGVNIVGIFCQRR